MGPHSNDIFYEIPEVIEISANAHVTPPEPPVDFIQAEKDLWKKYYKSTNDTTSLRLFCQAEQRRMFYMERYFKLKSTEGTESELAQKILQIALDYAKDAERHYNNMQRTLDANELRQRLGYDRRITIADRINMVDGVFNF